MAYGYSRFRKSSTGSVSRVGRGFSRIPKVAYRKKRGYYSMKFKGEKKYFDKTYQANTNESLTGQTTPSTSNNGVTYISNTWGDYSFGNQVGTAIVTSNDMLKGLATGTTARTRIGNKLRVNYVKGAFTFTAGAVDTALVQPQRGELVGELTAGQALGYLRTTFRFVIVKDLQVNSTDTQVTWQQVFDTTNLQAGVHSELNVDNMGRFIILEDRIFTLDADTPQKTCPFQIYGSKLGNVRYNGPSNTALTDKGLYVVWAAFVMGYNGGATPILMPSPVGHSRLCFSDE